jgi:predicted RNase H-like HicB family nuclease
MSLELKAEDLDLCKHYSMTIEWSDEYNAYIVTLPEFPGSHTHGATREEALQNGQEVLELLIESNREGGHPLPPASLFAQDEPAISDIASGVKQSQHRQRRHRRVS